MYHKKPFRHYVSLGLGVSVGVFLVGLCVWLSLLWFTKAALVESILSFTPRRSFEGINILAVGVDNDEFAKRSDTIIVLHLDKKKNRIGALSIPRDTRANLPVVGASKMNRAYSMGGIKLLKDTVASFLNIPIHHYVVVDINGIQHIVDKLGGVPIYIPKNMSYTDKAGGLHIDIKKGHRVLKGKDAEGYIRFRGDSEGDIGRIRRQQTFLEAFSKKLLAQPKLKIPLLLKDLTQYLETDMSIRDIFGFVTQFSDAFAKGNMRMGAIPGSVSMIQGVSYWRPDLNSLDKEIEEVLFGYSMETLPKTPPPVKTAKLIRPPTPSPQKQVSKPSSPPRNWDLEHAKSMLRIEILNGNGVEGSASKIAWKLKKAGFNVILTGDSKSFGYNKTLVVDWKNNLSTIKPLHGFLKLGEDQIVTRNYPKKPLDVTIVLGKDWETLYKGML